MRTRVAAALAAALVCGAAVAAEVRLTLPIPYRLVEQALVGQIYLGPDATAQILEGKNACNVLRLSDARVEGRDGQLRLRTRVTSRGGTPLPQGRCLPLFEWSGLLEARQEPYVLPGRLALGFRVVHSAIVDEEDGERRAVPDVLWGWVKQHVHPRLDGFVFDLGPALAGARNLLGTATNLDTGGVQALIDSLRLEATIAGMEALDVTLAFNAPDAPPGWAPAAPQPVLGVEELERWRTAWQTWDGFATWAIKHLARDLDPALRAELAAVLLDARHDLLLALGEDTAADPVRGLFVKTWTRLVPHLRRIDSGMPAAQALDALGFIAAGDVLQALDGAAPHIGLRLDRDTLRALARLLLPTIADSALDYGTAVDPDVRALLGFDPLLSVAAAPIRSPFAWLLREAQAATVDPAIAQRLAGWVPRVTDLDAFLAQVGQLLDAVAAAEIARGKVKGPYVEIYRTLLDATAWQETCWRQYEIRNGAVRAIQSAVGSIGIMQVNKHVWRGVYDVNALADDVGYNARAGNEILVHYFVDYALRKGEHKVAGDRAAAARATYAMYNGGPSQRARYRKPDTPAGLRRIDEAFWRKYQAVKDGGADAVKACYGP